MNYATISHYLAWPLFIYGMLFGSFANVVAYRVPRRESISFPPSHCPYCQHRIRPLELIPVVSWLFLRGACKVCKQSISVRYPTTELSVGILWALTVPHAHSWLQLFTWCMFWLFLLMIVGTDLTAMMVPDVLSLPAVLLFTFLVIFSDIQTWSTTLLGMFVSAGLLFGIHLLSRGRMGLGDVKLYLSIGAMLGPWLGIESFLLACLFGTVIGGTLLLTGVLKRGQPVPFVPYIALGTIVSAFNGQAILHSYLSIIQ